MADEQDLERKAVEELLREAARARIRAETIGPAGWARCPLRSTNKRFLLNTLRKTTLQQRTERAGSSRDGRQTTEPWFRRPQRVWASDDTRSRSPVKTQATRRTLSPKNSHVQTHHNDRHRHIHRPTITAHTPTNRLTNHNDKCTDRSTKMTDTHRQVRVTNKHTHSATKQAPSSSHK
ncbi:protein POLR1D-like [Conger conger]|uniref:protein POLR1D-like n=1 Tax=Conger conger TaxID=82655 RepID=UPI002A5A436F|nr:protein POLR1D-like [Conger conger]